MYIRFSVLLWIGFCNFRYCRNTRLVMVWQLLMSPNVLNDGIVMWLVAFMKNRKFPFWARYCFLHCSSSWELKMSPAEGINLATKLSTHWSAQDDRDEWMRERLDNLKFYGKKFLHVMTSNSTRRSHVFWKSTCRYLIIWRTEGTTTKVLPNLF